MKSIKEKAEEYTTENINTMGYKSQEHFDGFVTGANYVLEQIIEAIRVCDNDRNTDLYKSLWNCIEQLKK